MIDIHSHILPGIDDGSNSIAMTIAMLKTAERDGTRHMVATPHFCVGYGDATYDEVKDLVNKINRLAEDEKIEIKIYHGQEVYYSEKMIMDYKEGRIGTINNSRYMLFELPMRSTVDKEVFDIIYELKILNIVPILAHPERYKFIINSPWMINKFIEEGVLFQLNSGSIQGFFGDRIKKTATLLVEKGIYSFIGSDAHNDEGRCAKLAEGVKLAAAKNKIYTNLFKDNAEKLLNNEHVEFSGGKIKEKKSIFSFLK